MKVLSEVDGFEVEIGEEVLKQKKDWEVGSLDVVSARRAYGKLLKKHGVDAFPLIQAEFRHKAVNLFQAYRDAEISLPLFQRVFKGEFKNYLVASGVSGMGGSWEKMTRRQWGIVGFRCAKQYTFLYNFFDDLGRKDLEALTDQDAYRARLFANGGKEAYERCSAERQGWPSLPAYPGDGSTRCFGNCRCWWTVRFFEDHWKAYWHIDLAAEHCQDCLARHEEWSPLIIMKPLPEESLVPVGTTITRGLRSRFERTLSRRGKKILGDWGWESQSSELKLLRDEREFLKVAGGRSLGITTAEQRIYLSPVVTKALEDIWASGGIGRYEAILFDEFETLFHELLHTVNPCGSAYYTKLGQVLQEALTEQFAVEKAQDFAVTLGIRCLRERPSGTYTEERAWLHGLLKLGGLETHSERMEFFNSLKFNILPSRRPDSIVRLFQRQGLLKDREMELKFRGVLSRVDSTRKIKRVLGL